ncbi:MAG TPA: DNA-3-methyladenine glycosylase I [Casimicrobiaceae bacterium]|nr:DNA-3-methyladenine glycosylase I [Casimicrobiaceae bacterium]
MTAMHLAGPADRNAPVKTRVPPRPAGRCWWAGEDPLYIEYHDREWGYPVADDRQLFEKICLEGFQAGLSWRTILGKRDAFRAGFAGFNFARIARFDARDIERLVADASIVRHRGKIESVRNNARRAGDLVREFGSLAAYLWRFEPAAADRPKAITRDVLAAMPASAEAAALSKDLKRRGFTFVGPTTIYAFMQAMGLVNDHVDGCPIRAKAERARATFARPRTGA